MASGLIIVNVLLLIILNFNFRRKNKGEGVKGKLGVWGLELGVGGWDFVIEEWQKQSPEFE